MEKRVPPPLAGLLCGVLMWFARDVVPPLPVSPALRSATGVLLALAGLAIAGAGVRAVRRAGTTLNPLAPDEATALVTDGIYARTRNPMYLGMLVLLLGWAAFVASPLALAGPVLFVAWITRLQIIPEERALDRLFGERFADYCRRTRRWL